MILNSITGIKNNHENNYFLILKIKFSLSEWVQFFISNGKKVYLFKKVSSDLTMSYILIKYTNQYTNFVNQSILII